MAECADVAVGGALDSMHSMTTAGTPQEEASQEEPQSAQQQQQRPPAISPTAEAASSGAGLEAFVGGAYLRLTAVSVKVRVCTTCSPTGLPACLPSCACMSLPASCPRCSVLQPASEPLAGFCPLLAPFPRRAQAGTGIATMQQLSQALHVESTTPLRILRPRIAPLDTTLCAAALCRQLLDILASFRRVAFLCVCVLYCLPCSSPYATALLPVQLSWRLRSG